MSDKIAKASADVRKGKKNIDKPTKKEEIKFRSLGILLEHKFKVNTHSLKANVNVEYKDLSDNMNLIEVDPNFDFDENPYENKKSIQPIIESNNKGLQSNVFQPMDNNPIIVVANNDGGGEIGDDQTVRVPANQPNTQDSGELVMTDDPSSFLKTIKNEQLNIANSNILPHQIAQNLK